MWGTGLGLRSQPSLIQPGKILQWFGGQENKNENLFGGQEKKKTKNKNWHITICPPLIATVKKMENAKCWQVCGALELAYCVAGSVHWYNHLKTGFITYSWTYGYT